MEIGLVGTDVSFVRPRPVYSIDPFAPFACPFTDDTGAPSATADTTSGSGFNGNSSGFSSMGESGGGGMFVPAVRESRGARTGSSNFPSEVLVPMGRVAEGMVVMQCSKSAGSSKMIVLRREYDDFRNAEFNCQNAVLVESSTTELI
jgi:hypothetical protein